MYKTHEQTKEIIENSKLKTRRTQRMWAFIFLVVFSLIFAFSRYNASQAQAYKAKAVAQQKQAMMNANIEVEKAQIYLKQIVELTTNYKN